MLLPSLETGANLSDRGNAVGAISEYSVGNGLAFILARSVLTIIGSRLFPGLSVVENWIKNIAVPWNEAIAFLEVRLRSILSTAPAVNSSPYNIDEQTQPSLSNWAHTLFARPVEISWFLSYDTHRPRNDSLSISPLCLVLEWIFKPVFMTSGLFLTFRWRVWDLDVSLAVLFALNTINWDSDMATSVNEFDACFCCWILGPLKVILTREKTPLMKNSHGIYEYNIVYRCILMYTTMQR